MRYVNELSNKEQTNTIIEMLNEDYGYKELPVKTFHQMLFEQHKKKIDKIADIQDNYVPPHEHSVDNCREAGCRHYERKLKS